MFVAYLPSPHPQHDAGDEIIALLYELLGRTTGGGEGGGGGGGADDLRVRFDVGADQGADDGARVA